MRAIKPLISGLAAMGHDPMPILAAAAAWSSAGIAGVALVAAALGAFAGAFVERWLFFAEAKHTVTLYYGADAV